MVTSTRSDFEAESAGGESRSWRSAWRREDSGDWYGDDPESKKASMACCDLGARGDGWRCGTDSLRESVARGADWCCGTDSLRESVALGADWGSFG